MGDLGRSLRRLSIVLLFLLFAVTCFGEKPLTQLIADQALQGSYEPLRSLVILSRGGKRIVFRPGETWGVMNYSEILYLGPTERREGQIYLSEEAEDNLLKVLGRKSESRLRIAAVIIDPGHGGKDPGANHIHTVEGKQIGVVEKDIVLTIGKSVYEDLRRDFPDKQIILTRETDLYLTLEERTEIANRVVVAQEEAIIFVSIHANASLNPRSTGFEVWYLPPDYRRELLDSSTLDPGTQELLPILNTMLEEEITVESIILAEEISRGMEATLEGISENRGLKEESWFVVRKAKMPSVLVEVGFLTNPAEALRLTDPLYLQKIAKGIYNGIYSFIDSFERTSGFTEH